jgi:hypothetical protein
MSDTPKISQATTPDTEGPSVLVWLAGLFIPGIILALAGLAVLAWEANHPIFAVRIGQYLLERNHAQTPRGAVWQGILANRRSQVGIDSFNFDLQAESLPPALLTTHYTHEQRTANFQILRAHPRPAPLVVDQISRDRLTDLAQALHIHRRGQAVLQQADLPTQTFHMQARIRAQVALEDDVLFALIHRRLRAQDAAEAWTFVDMPVAEKPFWRSFLSQVIAADPADTALVSQSPVVAAACRALLATWQDSLRAIEKARLQTAWDQGTAFELRLLHNVDIFTGYAVIKDEFPVRFQVPSDQAGAILGPPPAEATSD